jgi:hypothetical protein
MNLILNSSNMSLPEQGGALHDLMIQSGVALEFSGLVLNRETEGLILKLQGRAVSVVTLDRRN